MQSYEVSNLGISISVDWFVVALLLWWLLCSALADLGQAFNSIRRVLVIREVCLCNCRVIGLTVINEGSKNFITV